MNKTLKKALSFCISAAITASMLVMPVSAGAAAREMSYSDGKLKFTPEEVYMGGATVIVASYNEDNTLKSVKTTRITDITLGVENEVTVDAKAGDKIMLWSNTDDRIKPMGIAVTVKAEDVPTPTETPDDVLNTYKFDFGTAENVEDGYMAVTKDTHYNSNIVNGLQFGLLGINKEDYKLEAYVDGIEQQQGQVIVLADSSDGKAIGAAPQEVANYKVPGDYPIRFSMKGENNHYYRVSVELTTLDDTKDAVATVTSERRRAIIMEETINAGETKTVQFTATIQNNYYKGPAITYKDDMLNIVAVGDNVAVSKIVVDEVTPKTTVWMYDDSTGCDYNAKLPYFPLQNYGGTGQYLPKYLPVNIAVSNQGEGGLNAADNMHWGCAKGNIKAGDYVYVQYGHNHKDGGVLEYLQCIPKYYEYASSVGAYTIFAGPIDRHNESQYNAETNIWSSTLGGFSKAAKYYTEILITGGKAKADEFIQKAKEAATGTGIAASVYAWADEVIAAGITSDGVKDVIFIDLNQPTLDWLTQVCEEIKTIKGEDTYTKKSTDYYFQVVKGGGVDGTHPNDAGADNTASFFFDEAKKVIADTENPIAQVQAAGLLPLITNMRAAKPYKVSEEIILAGGAGGAGWPAVYVPDNLPELPTEIKKIEFNEDGTVAKATVDKRSAKLEMGSYGIVVITIYDAEGNEKGKLYAVDQVDNTVDGNQEITAFRGDVTLGEDDTYKAVVLKAVDSEGGLIVDEENPETYSAVFEPTDIESYLITDEDGNGTEDFYYYGAIYEGETVTDLNSNNGWIVGGSSSKTTTLGVDGDRRYANFIAQSGNSAYVMKTFNSSIGNTGRYLLEADLQYVSGSGMKVTFAGTIKNASPFASDEITLYTIETNGSVKVGGVEAGALNTNSWATVKAILDMDAGTVSVSVAGGTPVVAEISNYAKFTSDITPTSLAGISFNASKAQVGIRISNLTAAKLYDDKTKATVAVEASDVTMGTAYVGEAGVTSASVLNGDSVTVTAVANQGYLFDSWTIDGVEFSKDAVASVRAYKDATIVANFVVETKPATVTVNYLDADGNEIKATDTVTTDADGDVLRSGNEFTLDASVANVIKLANADDATMYDVYTYDSSTSDSFTIAALEESNTINVVFKKLDGLYFDYEDFSNVTDDWGFTEGQRDNVSVSKGIITLLTQNKAGKTDIKTLDTAISSATKVTVGFDYRSDAGSGRSSRFDILDTAGNVIFSIYNKGVKNNSGGYYCELNANATGSSENIVYGVGDWLTVNLTMDFETKKMSGSITKTADGSKVKEIAETDILTATNLGQITAYDDYSLAPIYLDNVFFKAN